MGKEKKKDDLKEVVIELKVSMHCNACERTVAKAISKFKGVERFTTEMYKHKVVVTGRIDPQKLLKKLKKKTGKRVEIVSSKHKGADNDPNNSNNNNNDYGQSNGEHLQPGEFSSPLPIARPPFFSYCKESDVLMMFSDENPNACFIM